MKIYFLFIVCLVLIFNSCGTSVYAPINEVVDPSSQRGELNTSLTFNHGSAERYQVAVNYSPINNIAINYSGFLGQIQQSHSLAIGSYRVLRKKVENQYVFGDFYTGIVIGKHNAFKSENFMSSASEIQTKLIGEANQYF
ncbi:MAG: hypothetical protein RLZZ546_435, partial [Bacteroidota bacterium]